MKYQKDKPLKLHGREVIGNTREERSHGKYVEAKSWDASDGQYMGGRSWAIPRRRKIFNGRGGGGQGLYMGGSHRKHMERKIFCNTWEEGLVKNV